jgi:membrane-associated phospholipid phosphatase
VLLGTSQALTLGAVELGKFIIDRPRPFEVLQNVKLKHESSAVGSSFPSGHTSQAFAVATMLAYRTKPAVYIPALVWATFVGYGRIYVGVHYPTDVVAGMVVGVLMSSLVYAARGDVIDLKDRVFGTTPEVMSRITTPLLKLQVPIAFR